MKRTILALPGKWNFIPRIGVIVGLSALCLMFSVFGSAAYADRIKDMASIQGDARSAMGGKLEPPAPRV